MNEPPKTIRLYAAGFVLLTLAVLVFVQAAFNLNPLISRFPDQVILLYTLSTFIFIVLIVFGFILLRTVIKVYAERKEQKPGAQFKTSLLVWLISLTLVPGTLMFLFAYALMNRSIDKWFSAPVTTTFDATKEMVLQWKLEHEFLARSILNHLEQDPPQNLETFRKNFRLNAVMVLENDGRLIRSAAESGIAVPGLAERVLSQTAKSDAFFESGSNWIGARRLPDRNGEVLAVAFPRPDAFLGLTSRIADQQSKYQDQVKERNSFRDTYVLVLLLMTVLVLFAAVWIGLFLSKRITIPVEALSGATREISSGNLDHRVGVNAPYELGMLVTLFNDMADRLQGTTRELEARRRYMEIILENIPTGVISVDADLRVNKINRAARNMFSTEQAETLDQIFSGDDLRAIRELLDEARESSVTREISGSAPGAPADSSVTATRLMAGGVVLVVDDLTEVVRAQKATAWREVARRLAHEIKNPLTPIQLSAERIGRNVARLPAATPRVTNVIEECVDAIVEEVSSLKNLVDEFVRFSRLPAVARIPNSMKDLVDRTMALYEDRLNGIKVVLTVPEDLPPVLMDTLQMKRVLVNLIDNALEALVGESEQELKIHCELARDETMARLTIADTGRGIAPEDRERLFTPYFSTRKTGAGLGLAISSRIVADHGGHITAEANSPRGTRFVIELPVCQESSLSMTNPVSGSR